MWSDYLVHKKVKVVFEKYLKRIVTFNLSTAYFHYIPMGQNLCNSQSEWSLSSYLIATSKKTTTQ